MGILILLLVLAGRVHAGTYGVLTYEIQGETVAITDCDQAVSGSLVIPTEIEGKPVTAIGNWTFSYCRELVDIVLPYTLESIGTDAFERCERLVSIVVLAGVASIGETPFKYCSGLTTITVEEGNPNYASLDGVLFDKDLTKLIQHPARKPGVYMVPESVDVIEAYAFEQCHNLAGIVFPDSLVSIGSSAFSGCNGLIILLKLTQMMDMVSVVYSAAGK